MVRSEGKREVAREVEHYNLEAILSGGHRVRSLRGTQFRPWATARLNEYLVKGFAMDDERLENPPGKGQTGYFDELLERIRDIRPPRPRPPRSTLSVHPLAPVVWAQSESDAPDASLRQFGRLAEIAGWSKSTCGTSRERWFAFFVPVTRHRPWPAFRFNPILGSVPGWGEYRLMKLSSVLTSGLALAFCAAASAPRASAATPRRPNIVFILADDLGCAQVGAYGNSYYKTPNIDGLGRDGVRFTQAYSAAPVCSPTRSALMTGKAPGRTHVTDFIPGNTYPSARLLQPVWQRFLPLKEVTIAERFTEEGYVTGLIGKWHLAKAYLPPESVAEGPDRQGFGETFITHKPVPTADPESDAHNVGAITARALRFLDEHRAEPFFLLLSHNAVHAPIMAPKALVAKYPAQGNGHPEDVPVMAAMMEMVDDSVGQVLARLDALGLRENTLVIFYSDNGGLLRDAAQTPFRGGKAELHEGGIRVPLLMRWPGVIAPGRVSAALVNTMDFFPTLLELSGARPESNQQLDGISLASLIRTGVAPARDTLYWHYPHYHPAGKGPSDAIREGDWKLIEFFEGTLAGHGPALELFNLRDDVGEETNLAASQPERVAAMRARLANWRESVGAQLPTLNPAYDAAHADDYFPTASAR